MRHRVWVRRFASVALLTVLVTAVAGLGLAVEFGAGFEQRAADSQFPSAANDPHVAVVGIDRKTIERYGSPLPRDMVAELTRRLSAEGAAVIAFDVVYSSESEAQKPGDAALAAAINDAGNVILATEASVYRLRPSDIAPRVKSLSRFAAGLQGANFVAAHVQVTADSKDGINRTVPLVLDAETDFVPSLSFAAVRMYRGISGPIPIRPDGLNVGNRFVPTDAQHAMRLNFSSRWSDTNAVISVADVLAGSVPPSKLTGKIVLVGAIDSTLGDMRLAPVNKSTGVPGVLLHANAINTMLTATYLEPVGDSQTLLWVAIVTLVVGLAVLVLPLWLSPLVAFAVGVAYYVFTLVKLGEGEVWNIVYPLMAIIAAFLGAVVLRYFGETRQRRRVTALFAQYVPETVAQRLVSQNLATTAAEGERLDMTVLFCDLRGFTALSESLSPAIVRVMLNHYYDRVTDIVLERRGTLMKYVGDEVFAVWGAPLPCDDHPARALACAIAIQALTPELNRELVEMGAPEIAFGIGLNTGEAVAAHFGGGRRRQYDVVGDTVNVGARLCSSAGRGEIILSDEVLRRVPDPPAVEPVGPVELKGVSRELKLWRVPAASPPADRARVVEVEEAPARSAPVGTGTT